MPVIDDLEPAKRVVDDLGPKGSVVDDLGGHSYLATAARVGLPVAGMVAGSAVMPGFGTALGGGIGGAAGEYLGQKLEGSPTNVKDIALEGGLSAIPFLGKAESLLGKVALRGGEAAGLGGAGEMARSWLHDQGQDTGRILEAAGMGGLFGAAGGAVEHAIAPRVGAPEKPPVAPASMAEPEIHGPPLPIGQEMKRSAADLDEALQTATREPTTVESARADLSAGTRLLERSQVPSAQVAGEQLAEHSFNLLDLEEKGHKAVNAILSGLSPEERILGTQYMRGEVDAAAIPPKVAQAADALTSTLYEPWGERASRSVVTMEKSSSEMAPFTPLGGRYVPERRALGTGKKRVEPLRGLRRVTATAFRRKPDKGTPLGLEDDMGILAHRYVNEYAPLIARSEAFGGGRLSDAVRGAPDWGPKAATTYGQMVRDGAIGEAEIYKQNLDSIYSKQDVGKSLSKLGSVFNSAVLGLNWTTQTQQWATPFWHHGPINQLQGLARLRSPEVRAKIQDIAHLAPGMGSVIEEGHKRGPAWWLTSKVEGVSRGPMNAGVIPLVEKLSAQVQEKGPAGINAATKRRIWELGLKPEDLRGGVTDEVLARAYPWSSDRMQLVTGVPGETGPLWQTPAGRFGAGLQQYGGKATNLFIDDILSPLAGRESRQALMRGDPSLALLGAQRLATAVPAHLASSAAVSAPLGAAIGLNASRLSPERIGLGAANTLVGWPAQLAETTAYWNQDPMQGSLPPTVSLPNDMWREARQGDPRLLTELAAVALPSPYRQWATVARPTIRGLLAPPPRGR